LESKGKVGDGDEVIFKAGTSITLRDGFHAKAGSDFIAKLSQVCITPEELNNVAEEIPAEERSNIQISQELPIAEDIEFKIAPNPFRYSTKMSFDIPEKMEISIQVFDQTGRLVKQVLNKKYLAEGTFQMPLTSEFLKNGLYYVQLTTPTSQITKKVIMVDGGFNSNLD